MALTRWEALNDGAGVPKHDATGPEFIEEIGHEALPCGFIASGKLGGMLLHTRRVAGKEFPVRGAHEATLQDAINDLRYLLIAGGFSEECV